MFFDFWRRAAHRRQNSKKVLNENGFKNLHNALNNILKELELHTVEMHSGEKKVIVATPLENLNLSFNPGDFENVIELFDQAKLMLEIKNIII